MVIPVLMMVMICICMTSLIIRIHSFLQAFAILLFSFLNNPECVEYSRMRLGLVFSQYSLMRPRAAHSKDDCPDLTLKTLTVEEGRAGRGCRVAPEMAWHEAQQETSPEEAGPAEMADRKKRLPLNKSILLKKGLPLKKRLPMVKTFTLKRRLTLKISCNFGYFSIIIEIRLFCIGEIPTRESMFAST